MAEAVEVTTAPDPQASLAALTPLILEPSDEARWSMYIPLPDVASIQVFDGALEVMGTGESPFALTNEQQILINDWLEKNPA